MIPASRYSPKLADQLKEYLLSELAKAKNDRQDLERYWMRLNRLYRARPEHDVKNFPWPGAANLVVPLIATNVDIVFARLMALLFGPQNLWTCRPLNDQMVQFAPRLQELLEWAQTHELGVYDAVADFLLDLTKLGTGVLKTRYTRETKNVYEYRESQTDGEMQGQRLERQLRLMIKNHPSVHHVALANFYIPGSAASIQDAPWCAEKLSLTWSQLINRVQAGIYTNIHNLGAFWANERGSQMERHAQMLDRFIPSVGDRFEPYEFWLDWDIDGDGQQEALVCTIHEQTRSYLRIDFNPFFNQEKPYDFARYMRQPGRFYGIGMAEMLEHFQEEITTMHNQRIDNTAVQTAQVLKYRKGGNIKQDTPIYPGAKIAVDDNDELGALPLGNGMATSSIPNEQISVNYAKERVGVSDHISGADSASINYGTATTSVQQLREGAKRFDQVLREVRQCLGGVGTKSAELYQQFDQRGKHFLVMGMKDGMTVHQVLSFPLEIIRSGVSIDVTATSASFNKEIEARTNDLIMQRLTMYYGQLLQYMQLIINPQLPPQMREVAQQAATAGAVILRQMLDSYGKQDVDRLVPDLEAMLSGNQQQLGALYAGLGPGAGNPAMAQTNGAVNPMAALSNGAGGQAQLPVGAAAAGNGRF